MTSPNTQTEANTLVVIRHPKGALNVSMGARGIQDDLANIADYLHGVAGGNSPGEHWVDIHRGSTNAAPLPALAAIVLSSGSGTVGATLNGVALTATWATSDANSAGLISAVVRASSNALVQGLVGASSIGATATLASVAVGDYIEIQPVGSGSSGAPVRFTAIASTPTIGPGAPGTFTQAGSDTADATSLAAAINAHPRFKNRLYAVSAAAVVTIIQKENSTTVRYRIQKSASTFTLSAAGDFANIASVLVWALQKGKIGNCMTIAASGTGVTILGGLTRLGGGVGGDPTAPVCYQR